MSIEVSYASKMLLALDPNVHAPTRAISDELENSDITVKCKTGLKTIY